MQGQKAVQGARGAKLLQYRQAKDRKNVISTGRKEVYNRLNNSVYKLNT